MAGALESGDFSLFVGDLAQDVHDQYLADFFRTYFTSVKGAKVIMDPVTGRSKGYGFVRFALEPERDKALSDMNGVYISTRPVRVSLATARNKAGDAPPPGAPRPLGGGGPRSHTPVSISGPAGEDDPHNTTVFVGNLSPFVNEDFLRSTFARFGDIVYVKIPPGKGCGFVQFTERQMAEYAMTEMQGQYVGSTAVRLSWGKSSTRPAAAPPPPVSSSYSSYGSYGYSYDPYGAYTGFGDPYAAYYGASYGPGGTSGGANRQAGPAPVYDPLAPVSVEKFNNMYIHRLMPVYTASFADGLLKGV